ncbi:MAG: thioredoxin domain-containing protein [Proteobacteria bacterium]|nr:thioredoxin domain-containing protein [Pseudomonadota bacterium]
MNTINSQKTLRQAVLLCVVMLAAACNQNKKGDAKADKTAKTEDKTAKVDDKAATEKGDKPSGPCSEYADKLCEIATPASPTCQSIKTAADIMPEAACKAGMTDIAFSKTKIEEKRKLCDELMEKLCKDIGPETKTCGMIREQTPKFPPERCAMMMKDYPKVIEDLKRREEANKPLTAEKQKKISDGDVPAFGPKDSKITIVEFSDFQCPYCSRAAAAASALKKKYSDKIRFVFRQFPLSFHKQAHLASQAALAANAQGKFWEYHDKLFENQRALERTDLEKYAKELGLNMGKFKKALDDEVFKKAVDDDMELGKLAAVSGTPTLFLNGERVQNPTDAEAISKEIDKALAK